MDAVEGRTETRPANGPDGDEVDVPLVQIDAFADALYEGNPAAVMPLDGLDRWPDDVLLQKLAIENNLSETAFYRSELPSAAGRAPTNDPAFHLRWFTPGMEVTLCGHATLATAAYLFEDVRPEADLLWFHTLSGWLSVHRGEGVRELVMDFPADRLAPCEVDEDVADALGVPILQMFQSLDLVCVLATPEQVADARPDHAALARLEQRGVIITAAVGGSARFAPFDFVSRWFGARAGVGEDPVTGSLHTQVAPYWTERLGRTTLLARQVSARGGTVRCEVRDRGRVQIAGCYRRYSNGVARVVSTYAPRL